MLLVFAETDGPTGGTWVGIAAIAVTGLLALANKIVERRHSSEIEALKTAQAQCLAESERCERDRQEDREELERTREEMKRRDDEDRHEYRTKIARLETELAKKKDKTEVSPPI